MIVDLVLQILLVSWVGLGASPCHSLNWASEKPQKPKFDYVLVSSGFDSEQIGLYRRFVDQLNVVGGPLDQLGIPRGHQVVEFLKGNDLNAIVAAPGGYPVAHYYDGSLISNALSDFRQLVYEVVYSGKSYHHGFYRDDSPVEQQKSILIHVIGHNHFATRSVFDHYRGPNSISVSKNLSELLEKYYVEFGHDEVARWYLFLQTASNLRDMYSARYQTPKDFQFQVHSSKKGSADDFRWPKSATENVFAALISALPPTTPSWKRELAEAVFYRNTFVPALIHTQVMNEGWASFLQELVIKHVPEAHTTSHWLGAMKVMSGAEGLKISDPYSLGVHSWRRIYERFLERTEVRSLASALEKDRQFILYADREIISKMDDFQFLEEAIDSKFLIRFKLAIARRAFPSEQKMGVQPPKPGLVQYVVSTRDRDRIVRKIQNEAVYLKFRFVPRVKLVSLNRRGSGEIELVVNDPVGKTLPMEPSSLTPALYILSRIMERPVSFLCSLRSDSNQIGRFRVVVSPMGKVQVYRDESAEVEPSLLGELSGHLRDYLEDLYLEDDQSMKKFVDTNPELLKLSQQMVTQLSNSTSILSLHPHAPTVPQAMLAFESMLQRRMIKAIQRSLTNPASLRRSRQGVFVKALPSVPTFAFETQSIAHRYREEERLSFNKLALEERVFHPDELGNGSIIETDQGQGGLVWGPGDEGSSGGRPGSAGGEEGEGSGRKPGEASLDPSWVPLPEDLYARMLAEKIRLPRINPKPGESRNKNKKLRGRKYQKEGHLLPLEVLLNASKKGAGKSASRDEDLALGDFESWIEEGLTALLPEDFVVRKTKVLPKPDMNAVITFVMDQSASVAGFLGYLKRMSFDIKTLVKTSYKGVQFRFVVFDSAAHDLKSDENKFFRAQLGGGTSYAEGLKKVNEIYASEYPRSQFDRYTLIYGDLEDFDVPQTMQEAQKIINQGEFVGWVHASRYDVDTGLGAYAFELSETNPYVGYVQIRDPKNYSIKDIKVLFKNEE